MPSGAKKRKAARKKLEKQQSNNFIKDNNNSGSHSNSNKGSDEPKFRDERDGDGDVVEKEGNVEIGLNSRGDEGEKEASFGEANVMEEVKQEENLEDVIVHTDDVAREFESVTSKSTSSSGGGSNSSSSSDDDEVVVEKEESVETESGTLEPENESLSEEVVAPRENVEPSLDNMVEEFVESFPTEELVKVAVSIPEESTVVIESVLVDVLSTSDVNASGLEQNLDEAIQSFEKSGLASGVTDLVESKIEQKVMPVLDVGSENTSEPIVVTPRNGEEALSQSSSVKAVEVEDNGKASETHKHTEEEPLLSSAPMTVRRTSWTNCCGLLEAFSGGAR